MNPLADLLELPVWQFLLVYGGVAVFAGVFLAYVRWEVRQVEEAGQSGLAPVDAAGPVDAAALARGRGAVGEAELARLYAARVAVTPQVQFRVRAIGVAVTALFAGLCAMRLSLAMERGKPVTGLAIALAATLVGGLALALPPLWLTARGEALVEEARRRS